MESNDYEWVFVVLFYCLPLVGLVVFGLIGSAAERRHFASIRQREAATLGLPAVPTRAIDPERIVAEARMVSACVVVSLDYFKRFLAGWRNIFGGRVQSYETLLDRARREAVLRLKEACPGADEIVNVRLQTSSIANTRGKQGAGGIEVLAYGTMVRYVPAGAVPPPLGS